MAPLYRQQYEWMEKINKEGVNLSEWELEFMKKISSLLIHGFKLSDKQAEVLENIYAKRTP